LVVHVRSSVAFDCLQYPQRATDTRCPPGRPPCTPRCSVHRRRGVAAMYSTLGCGTLRISGSRPALTSERERAEHTTVFSPGRQHPAARTRVPRATAREITAARHNIQQNAHESPHDTGHSRRGAGPRCRAYAPPPVAPVRAIAGAGSGFRWTRLERKRHGHRITDHRWQGLWHKAGYGRLRLLF
jgi:hypothetical protein